MAHTRTRGLRRLAILTIRLFPYSTGNENLIFKIQGILENAMLMNGSLRALAKKAITHVNGVLQATYPAVMAAVPDCGGQERARYAPR